MHRIPFEQAARDPKIDTGPTGKDLAFGLRVRRGRGVRASSCLGAVLLLLFAPAVTAGQATQGDAIVNVATVISDGAVSATSSGPATVTVRIPSLAKIELLQYAPGAHAELVVQGAYQPTQDPVAFALLPLPRLTGAAAPLDLSQPLPLAVTRQYHQGDPVFIRLTDLDQNMDRTVRETVIVSLSDDLTGDAETVRLTENGPDTGVFIGYLPTARVGALKSVAPGAQPNDGVLEVIEQSVLTARYVDPTNIEDAVSAPARIDPLSVFFDSRTGAPVSGAAVTIVDLATGQPARVWTDNGIDSFPSSLVSGQPSTDGAGRIHSFPAGQYRFPYLRSGNYRLDVKPPPGYAAPSTAADTALQLLPGAPFTLDAGGSRGQGFLVGPGPAVRVDIPLDPVSVQLWVQKTAARDRVGIGDVLAYDISITNLSAIVAAFGVTAIDTLPVGFRFKPGSVRIDGVAAKDPSIGTDGRALSFDLDVLAPGASRTVRLVALVGAGAAVGLEATNLASATALGGVKSNTATATVLVSDDFLKTRSVLMGRITTGACDEAEGVGSEGLPGARVFLEDGTFVSSDKRGLFHFEGIVPGLHVIQLDLDSLPDGFEAVSCTRNDRFAGRAFSQFVEVQGGTLWRADFHVRGRPVPKAAPVVKLEVEPPKPMPGELIVSLSHHLDGMVATFQAEARGTRTPLDAAVLVIAIPEGLLYDSGSATLEGLPVLDPVAADGKLSFPLGSTPAEAWKRSLSFRAHASPESKEGKATVTAALEGGGQRTPEAENILDVRKVETGDPIKVVLRPHFPSMSDALGPADRAQLDRTAKKLKKFRPEKITVIGHTDAQKISLRARKVYADNQALSLGRAGSVARYLMEALHLPAAKVIAEGKGEKEPIATNLSAAGRQENRRVEVLVIGAEVGQRKELAQLKADSGEQRVETTGLLLPVVALANPSIAPMQSNAPLPEATTAAVAGSAMTNVAPAAGAAALAPAAGAPAALAPAALAPATAPQPLVDGFLSPADGALLADRIGAVQLRVPSYLAITLAVDGKEVDQARIGYKSEDHVANKTVYTFVGVDFGEKGAHALTVTGKDPFGNVRLQQTAAVTRTGEIAAIRQVSSEGNVADARTPVRMRFELLDTRGDVIHGSTRLELREGTLQPLKLDGENLTLEDKAASRRVSMDNDGWVQFQPVGTSGSYRAVLGYGTTTVEAETWVQPKMRDWILVGFAEGTAGYATASGNLEALQDQGAPQDLYKEGRVALYAKGQIKGQWLVTMAYDSGRNPSQVGNSLFQIIDPQAYYTLYGDSTQQGYDAPSARKLYLKIEREQFYALFGDFDTGLTVTELSRYSRRMNGVKAELQTRNVEVNAFGARTDKAYARDEIPGDGTSGLYHLGRRGITVNSEVIKVVTRDRFHSETIIAAQTMGRFLDYSIDYESGTLFFREPIPSRDPQFNPVTIEIEYETQALSGQDYTAGGRAGVKLLDQRLRAGATFVHEGQGDRQNDLYGVDAKLQVLANTRLRGEFALTDSRQASLASAKGEAWLAELQHVTHSFDGRVYLREQQGAFGLGQQSFTESGTRKLGVDSAYRVNDRLSLSGQAYRQDTFASDVNAGSRRYLAEARLNYVNGPYGAYTGLLDTTDKLADGSDHTSRQFTIGGKLLLRERLTLGLDYAQSVWGNGSADFPTRIGLRAEYKLSRDVALLAAEELTFGNGAATQHTRVGLRSTLWKGGTLTSSVERQLDENAGRVFGNIGLRQLWQLTDAWKVDVGGERTQTVRHLGYYQFNANVPAASGGGEDFTALSTGASYQIKSFVWESRAELRTAQTENKWALISGIVSELGSGWAWSGRGQYLGGNTPSGAHTTSGNLRFGLVYRPAQTRWIVLNRLDWLVDRSTGTFPYAISVAASTGDVDSWRVIDNLILNVRPRKSLQLSLGYGGKYGRERISDSLYQGYTDQSSAEARYDVTENWDLGARASVLHTWANGAVAYSAGPSVGFSPVTNVWLSVGYNLLGYHERDFSAANYTDQGPYLRLRLKFDQDSVKEAAGWLNKQ